MKLQGQQHTDSLQVALIQTGLENVAVFETNKILYITYGNNRYRSETKALAEVIYLVNQYLDSCKSVSILISANNSGILAVTFNSASLKSFFCDSIDFEQFISNSRFSLDIDSLNNVFEGIPRQNRSYFKFDVPVGLGVRYLLGAFDYPVRVAVDLLPALHVELAKGLSATAQLAIPLYNDLDKNNFTRPGIMTLTQDLVLKHNIYVSVSTGCFSRNRLGVHSTVKKYFFEECLAFGLDLGYTRYTTFTGKVDYPSKEDHDYSVYMFLTDFRVRKYDLNIQAGYGRFLYQDEGYMVDVTRKFSETSIGFFALSTTSGTNAGFKFSVAIPPRKYSKHNSFRIRPDNSFSLSYRVVGAGRLGRTYSTGNNLLTQLPDFYPSFISKDLKKYLIPLTIK